MADWAAVGGAGSQRSDKKASELRRSLLPQVVRFQEGGLSSRWDGQSGATS